MNNNNLKRLAAAQLAMAVASGSGSSRGFNNDDDPINVHFVPHSHMDAGWLKTYDEYYNQEVSRLFKSVFLQLQKDAKYTYTVGDIAFFRRYYLDLKSDSERQQLKSLF